MPDTLVVTRRPFEERALSLSLSIRKETRFHECRTACADHRRACRAGGCGAWDGHVYPCGPHQHPYAVWSDRCPHVVDPGRDGGFEERGERIGCHRYRLRADRADLWRHAAADPGW